MKITEINLCFISIMFLMIASMEAYQTNLMKKQTDIMEKQQDFIEQNCVPSKPKPVSNCNGEWKDDNCLS